MNVRHISVILLCSIVSVVGLKSSYCTASARHAENPVQVEQMILAMNYFSSQRVLPCKFRVSYVSPEDGRSKVSISDQVGIMAEAAFSNDDFCGNSMRVKMLRQIASAETNNGAEYVGSAALFAYRQGYGFYGDFDVEVILDTNRSVAVFFCPRSLRQGDDCLVTVSFMKDAKAFCVSPGK